MQTYTQHACMHACMRRALGAFRSFQVAGSLGRTDLCRHVQSGSCNRSLKPQTLEPETLAFGLKPQGTLKPKTGNLYSTCAHGWGVLRERVGGLAVESLSWSLGSESLWPWGQSLWLTFEPGCRA